jgi:hypothetical protein
MGKHILHIGAEFCHRCFLIDPGLAKTLSGDGYQKRWIRRKSRTARGVLHESLDAQVLGHWGD